VIERHFLYVVFQERPLALEVVAGLETRPRRCAKPAHACPHNVLLPTRAYKAAFFICSESIPRKRQSVEGSGVDNDFGSSLSIFTARSSALNEETISELRDRCNRHLLVSLAHGAGAWGLVTQRDIFYGSPSAQVTPATRAPEAPVILE